MKPNPKKPDDRFRVHRGGGWNDDGPLGVRAASRGTNGPAGRLNSIGFRCALAGRTPRV